MNSNQKTEKLRQKKIPDNAFLPRLSWFIQAFIATGIFSGYFPLFPGTVGSLLGAAILWITPAPYYFLLIIFSVAAGTWAADAAAKRWGKDPSPVVIDEVAGIFITLALFPKQILYFLSGFILFRILDILKPFPCRSLEKLPGGFGIMLDDIAAAIYACILLYAVFIFIN